MNQGIYSLDFQNMERNSNITENRKPALIMKSSVAFGFDDAEGKSDQAGFSLIEVVCAMVIFLIAILGVFVAFTYAISYNGGNGSRAQALAILQEKVEKMRSAEWTLTTTDGKLAGGVKPQEPITLPDGNKFIIQVVVDDNPFDDTVMVDTSTKLKEISVTVKLDRPTPGWQTSVPATVVLRRVRGN
jgi:prepilin-type N-terminal cleavage/methylation domain-containing protein